MKRINLATFVFFFCYMFSFCKSGYRKDLCSETGTQYNRTKEIGSDSVEFYIYKEIKDFESDLQLSQIECTRDSIYFRLWLAFGSRAEHYIWDCQLKDGNWTGYRFVYEEDQSGFRVMAKLIESDWFRPSAGWSRFSNEFLSLDIENKESPLRFGLDETFLGVEISKGTRYTFYVDVPEQSKLAAKLLDIMKTNLEFKPQLGN